MQTPCDSCKLLGRPLTSAAKQGHIDCLYIIVNKGVSVEEKSEAFCKALKNNNFKCAEFLLDTGIDVKFKCYHHGDTPLIRAAYADQCSFMQKVIAAGASVNAVNTIGNGAIHCSRSKECTELLIREGADLNLKHHAGMTPLHYAVHHKSIGCIVSLILAGADVNMKHHGLTPLHSAILNYESTDRSLFQAGADVNATDSYNGTALTSAANHGHDKSVKLLLKAHEKGDPQTLMNSAVCGSEGYVKLLIEAAADVNIYSRSDTALHYAAMQGLVSCVDLLLRAGAYVNALNANGKSSLMLAASSSTLDSVKLLLQAGAEVRLTDRVGCSALHYSVIKHVRRGKSEVVTEIVRLLHAAGERKEEVRSLHKPLCDPPRRDPLRKAKVTDMVRLPYAAGERKEGTSERSLPMPVGRPGCPHRLIGSLDKLSAIARQYLCEDEPTLCLMHICRQTIREHLLQMSRVNLFVRVPHLGLPSLLAEFLLYDLSVEL